MDAARPAGGVGATLRRLGTRALAWGSVPFFLVACTFTYYGQLHRKPSGDTYGTVYTSVALVQQRTVWLDDYLPYIQERAGERPYMLTSGPRGHIVTATPTASSLLAVPVVAVFSAFGTDAGDFDAWMEAGMLTAALTTAASVALMFVLLTRLTTRRRATLIAATYAWGTLAWGISGQALWQHAGVALVLTAALLAFVDRRLVLAGGALGAMVAFRLTTGVIAPFLLPLVGRRPRAWGRLALGTLPYVLALAAYNAVAFGSPLEQGYGTGHVVGSLQLEGRRVLEGVAGLLLSPGRGLFVYSPVLVFALVGVIRARHVPLYRWCGLAAAAYLVVAANSSQWHGGESFGARRLVDVLPLLTVLIVPALDWVVGSNRRLWAFAALLAWSVFVQLLGAAAWPPATWYEEHDLSSRATWWNPTDNELVALLTEGPEVVVRLLAMLALLAASIAVGIAASRAWPSRAADGRGE